MKSEDALYKYTGDGLGIPGLPHELSKAEAERLGVAGLLEDAIKAGKYTPLDPPIGDGGKTKVEVKNDRKSTK